MVRFFLFFLFLCISTFSISKELDNSKLYKVPSDEEWVLSTIKKSSCTVCTSDIYIKNGSVKINSIWVSGTFEFTLKNKAEIIFGSNTTFALGDTVKNVNIETHSKTQ